MPFGVEDFHDLVRLLEARPEWRPELRRLVLSDELLALPEQVARFRTETEHRFQELLEAQSRTETRLAELAEAQRRTDIRLGELAEAQRRTETRLAELADAQGRTETRLGELAEAQQRTEARLAALADTMAHIAMDVAGLAVDTGDMKGDILEMRYRRRVHSISADSSAAPTCSLRKSWLTSSMTPPSGDGSRKPSEMTSCYPTSWSGGG